MHLRASNSEHKIPEIMRELTNNEYTDSFKAYIEVMFLEILVTIYVSLGPPQVVT